MKVERTVTKSYDNGVSTWYEVDLDCGHRERINWTVRVGWMVRCITCQEQAEAHLGVAA